MTTDPIAAAARSVAGRLATEYGSGLAAEVDAALHTRGTVRPPDRYLDPVSLGSLIVAIATLAWSIYSDQLKKTSEPSPDVVARHVRAELRKQGGTGQQEIDHITEIVAIEIIQAARDTR